MRWILISALAVAACGGSQPASENATPKTAEPAKAEAAPPALTADGVGGLDASSTVDQASLEAAFPGYEVRTATRSSEGESLQVFELYRNDKLSMTVEPSSTGKVYRISIIDLAVKSPAGVAVGASYGQLSQAVPDHECFRLVEERSDSVACYAKSSTIGYVLGDAAKGHKPGAVPPADVLAKSTVTEILWLPESD